LCVLIILAGTMFMQSLTQPSRIQSIDILRGIIIVIMALDHVRDFVAITPFAPEDISQTTPVWFFTRWITHFCAPTFVFLAGMSAFLYAQRVTKDQLRKFLVTRGLWLIFIELIVVTFGITFQLSSFILQVIWVIGLSMIILAGLTYLPRIIMIVFTVVLLVGHNLLDATHIDSIWWYLFHEQNWFIPLGPTSVTLVYPLVPWPAVMSLGFLLGELFLKQPATRDRQLILIGSLTILGFVVLRFANVYGDMHPWSVSDRGVLYTFLDFLNTTKYPPSLLFLAMTLGLSILVLSQLEKWKGKIGEFFLIFGRVPFFFYIVHFYLIHVTGLLITGIAYGDWRTLAFHDPKTWPAAYVPSVTLMYLVWIGVIAVMYFLCRWFVEIKKRRTEWWLKYL
jgi:uncharacterized membrane protein